MSEPHDRVELGPPADDEQSGLRRAPYAALAAAGIVVATVFATVAALAGERADGARQPPAESNPIVVNTASDTSVDAPTSSTGPTETAPAAAPTTSTTENPARTTTRRRPTTTTTRSTQTSPTPTQPTETQPTETQPPSSEPTSTTTSTTTTTTTTTSSTPQGS